MDATLPNELSTLQELVSTLQGALSAAQIENKLLRQKLELFLKRYFGGTRNEGLDPKQLELLLAGLAALTTAAPATEQPTPTRSTVTSKAVRQPLPAHLETERVVLEPEEVQQQPEGWRKLGEEVTEELDWKPAQFIKRLYIRPKYAKAERIVIAPLPARLIEKGLPGAALLAQVRHGLWIQYPLALAGSLTRGFSHGGKESDSKNSAEKLRRDRIFSMWHHRAEKNHALCIPGV